MTVLDVFAALIAIGFVWALIVILHKPKRRIEIEHPPGQSFRDLPRREMQATVDQAHETFKAARLSPRGLEMRVPVPPPPQVIYVDNGPSLTDVIIGEEIARELTQPSYTPEPTPDSMPTFDPGGGYSGGAGASDSWSSCDSSSSSSDSSSSCDSGSSGGDF